MDPSAAPWRALDAAATPAAPEITSSVRRTSWLVIGGLVAAISLVGFAFLITISSASGTNLTLPGDSASGGPSPDSAKPSSRGDVIVVDVGGAVARPGVYELHAPARVADAIKAAGGFGPRVDAMAADRMLNLAAQVHDGDEVRVPSRDDRASARAPVSSGASAGPIDLNSATAEQLDALPGVGPATVAKIVAARDERRFTSVDDLKTRKIVGEATLEKLRPMVTVAS